MKSNSYFISLLVFVIICATSCRKEEFAFEGTVPERGLQGGSAVAILLQSVALNDGSVDNILDEANCFTVAFPVEVIANGITLTLQTLDDLEEVEDTFEMSDEDEDSLNFVFPITIILEDYSEVLISNATAYESLRAGCPMENEDDDDIECVDIKYPIRVSLFNPNSEITQSIAVANDRTLLNFIKDIEEGDLVTINFPITLVLSDDTEVLVNDLQELETSIDSAKDSCDEDDDYDYDDDDCDECSMEDLMMLWSGCSDWTVEKLIRNDENIVNNYPNLMFNFLEDGTAVATSNTDNFTGTWSASGSGNMISMTIDIPSLDDFNDTWLLNETPLSNGSSKVKLRVDSENVLWLENTCSNGNASENVNTILQDGSWEVETYLNNGIDETADFNDYDLEFNINNVVTADNGTAIPGTWIIQNEETRLALDFGTQTPLDKLNNAWRFKEVTETVVELIYIGAAGRRDTLILEKE